MKHIILAILSSGAIALAACSAPQAAPLPVSTSVPAATPTGDAGSEAEVRGLVESFGQRLKLVSLLAPSAAQDIQNHYAEFVSPALLETWMNDVSQAPGRMVSSPWPDRIEIASLTQETSDRYAVEGSVVEITSTEIGTDKAANRLPVHIVVERQQGHWLITGYTSG